MLVLRRAGMTCGVTMPHGFTQTVNATPGGSVVLKEPSGTYHMYARAAYTCADLASPRSMLAAKDALRTLRFLVFMHAQCWARD